MAIRIGKVELTGVQSLHTEESRTLVEQRVPEQQGSGFQDLGREPVTLVLDGFLHGEDASSTLETLRAAQAKAEPMAFAADIVVGTELTEVIIESFRVRQVAGSVSLYQFVLRLREYVESPRREGVGTATVNAAATRDAEAWGADQMAASGVLQDLTNLPAALAANPGMLAALTPGELAGALGRDMSALSAGQLDGVLGAIANADPKKAESLLGKLKGPGSLGIMLAKYAEEGVSFLKGIDLNKLGELAKAFSGGLDFLQKLIEVGRRGTTLIDTICALDLPKGIGPQLPPPKPPT